VQRKADDHIAVIGHDHKKEAHDAGVVQRKADGHIAVIGHDHKKEALQVSKKQEDVHLCQATCIGDGGYLVLHVLQEFRGKAEVRQGQVAEKQIHGCVEVGVQ
jgi:methylglyoxal synthase